MQRQRTRAGVLFSASSRHCAAGGGTAVRSSRGPRRLSLSSRRSFSGSRPPPQQPLRVGSFRYRASWGVHLIALAIAGTSTFYFSQSAWLNGLGDEPCYHLDRLRNDKRPVVFSEDYDQNWWGLERLLPTPLTLQDRKYHSELAQGLVDKGVIQHNQFIMPEVPTKEDLRVYNSPDYLIALNHSRRIAAALGNATLRYFPSLVIHTFISGFMLEAVGGTVLASRVALERGWAINLGGGFHHASASEGSQGCMFNDVSLAIKHVQQSEKGRVTKVLIVDLASSRGDGFIADFGLDDNVCLIDSYTAQSGDGAQQARVGSSLVVPRQGMAKEEYLGWVAAEVEKAITNFRPQMIFYISGSSPANPTQGEGWVTDRDALMFQLAVDTHSIPLVMVVSGGWTPGNDPNIMANSIARILAQH